MMNDDQTTLIQVSEWKEAECDDCGGVFKIVKWIPLKFSCCKTCGSLKIRLYHSRDERAKRTKQ